MSFRTTMIGAAIGLFLFYLFLLMGLLTQIRGKEILGIFLQPDTLFSIRLSLITATLATVLALLIGLPAGYALSRYDFWGKRIIDTFLEIPLIMSPVALGASLLIFFGTPAGELIQKRGIYFVFEFPGIILAQFATVAGLATRLIKTSLDEISPRFEAVARSLGSTSWRAFYQVTLPLSFRALVASIILCWAKAIGEFGATVTLAGAMPGKTETMPIAIFMNLASADITKTAILILILTLLGLGTLFGIRLTAKKQRYD